MTVDRNGAAPSVVGGVFVLLLFIALIVGANAIGNRREACQKAGGAFVVSAIPFDWYCLDGEVVIDS